VAPAPAPTSTAVSGASGAIPAGARPRLVVLRGQHRNVEYPILPGHTFIGRADDELVDIDLEGQEPPDSVRCARQHAVIRTENGGLILEDLNSANGTYLNRHRIEPGQPNPLKVNDVIQIGHVQLKVVV
jgi:pSer/pThr/pTyr-binding forkhead associated (FHA) protein